MVNEISTDGVVGDSCLDRGPAHGPDRSALDHLCCHAYDALMRNLALQALDHRHLRGQGLGLLV